MCVCVCVCVCTRASAVTWVDRSRVQVHVHIPWNCTICLPLELYHLPPIGTVPVVSHWHCTSCLPLAAMYQLSPTGTVPFVSHWRCTSCLPLALYQLSPTGTPRVVSRCHCTSCLPLDVECKEQLTRSGPLHAATNRSAARVTAGHNCFPQTHGGSHSGILVPSARPGHLSNIVTYSGHAET